MPVTRRLFLRGSLGIGSLGIGSFGTVDALSPGDWSRLPAQSRALPSQDRHAPLVPTYARARAERPAVHGLRGLGKRPGELPETIRVVWSGGSAVLGRAQLGALERVEQVTDHRCADGWSAIVHWSGVRVGDLLRSCGAPTGMSMTVETPDRGYRVVLDSDTIHHPQTLLVDELGGRPLDPDHGAPWRLVVPTRHARFSLKRVGTLRLGVS